MIEQKFIFNQFSNFGYILSKLDESLLTSIKSEVNDFLQKGKQFTSGGIDDDLLLIENKSYIEKLIFPFCEEYDNFFNYEGTKYGCLEKKPSLYLDGVWANFQKKYEYSPVHNHRGVYSFVIWLDIPYSIENEEQHECSRFPSTLNRNLNNSGKFQFIYTTSIGAVSTLTIPTDKTYNNHILFFPSDTHHCVYPFYSSDEYRISISGNFKYRI